MKPPSLEQREEEASPYLEWRTYIANALTALDDLQKVTCALVPVEPALAPRLVRLLEILDQMSAELMRL